MGKAEAGFFLIFGPPRGGGEGGCLAPPGPPPPGGEAHVPGAAGNFWTDLIQFTTRIYQGKHGCGYQLYSRVTTEFGSPT